LQSLSGSIETWQESNLDEREQLTAYPRRLTPAAKTSHRLVLKPKLVMDFYCGTEKAASMNRHSAVPCHAKSMTIPAVNN
jgi:hypothetical protein